MATGGEHLHVETEVETSRRIPPPPTVLSKSSDEVKSISEQKSQKNQIPVVIHKNVQSDSLPLESDREIESIVAFPTKPNPGTLGKPINLIANYFNIKIPEGNFYHYDVEIDRKSAISQDGTTSKKTSYISAEKNRNIINKMAKTNKAFVSVAHAFDGKKNLITGDLFPRGVLKIPVNISDDEGVDENYVVTIKPVEKSTGGCSINLKAIGNFYEGKTKDIPLEVVMGLEIIMRETPTQLNVPVGRSFFSSHKGVVDLGKGKEIWFGYYQSVQLAQWKPMLNVDTATTTFYKSGAVINFVRELLDIRLEQLSAIYLRDRQVIELTKELKNLKIVVNHLKYRRKYRINKVTSEPASRLTFTFEENGRIVDKRVSTYFFERYGLQLKYPNLPCLHVGPKEKKVYLPLEVCELLENQHCKKKLDETQITIMVRQTAKPPEERFQNIEEMVKQNVVSDPVVKRFGLSIDTSPLSLQGRVIDPPEIRYKDIGSYNKKICMPREGVWSMGGKCFYRPAEIERWVLLSLVIERYCNRQALKIFADMLHKVGKNCGMIMQKVHDIGICNPRDDMRKIFSDIKRKYQPQLAVVVMDKFSNYAEIKNIADTKFGIVTQCVKCLNVKRNNYSLLENICQKINTKMGGTNNSIEDPTYKLIPKIFSKPVIIIGADVAHPVTSEDTGISISVAVGSLDKSASRYHAVVRMQENAKKGRRSQEIILNLKDMVKELLLEFYGNTRCKKPEKIIFYRDGVSNGQFQLVQNYEVTQVRNACYELEKSYKPPITFIVVQKRHHTRFRPSNPSDGVGKMKNIPPGTTVDQYVVHPVNYDFFLCSHFALKGTSRPAHYTILWDDNDFSADDIQMLTYYLCHNYAKCTRSISIPTPVRYADLLAYRMKLLLDSTSDQLSATSGYSNVSAEFKEVMSSITGVEKMFFI